MESFKSEIGDRIYWTNKHGDLHRLDGPAIESNNGTKEWFVNGVRHRVDGPAVEYASGLKEWWFKGKRHRVGGPAVIRDDGSEQWWYEGGLHRVDGPAAIEKPLGFEFFYFKGYIKSKEAWFNLLSEAQKLDYLFKIKSKQA